MLLYININKWEKIDKFLLEIIKILNYIKYFK